MPRRGVKPAASAALLGELQAAKAEHQQGRLDSARKRYQRVLRQQPQLTEALHFLGVLEHMDGNSELGLRLVQQAFARSPGDPGIRRNLANLLTDINRCEDAEPLYRGLLAECPDDATHHANHCVVLRKLGRQAEAIAAGRQAVALAPSSAVAWLGLAHALASAGDLREAVSAYERVISIDPSFSPAHNSLCQTWLRIEREGLFSRWRLTRTRQAYRRWVEAVPDHPTARFLLEVLEGGRTPERVPDEAVRSNFDGYAADFDKHIRSLGYCAPERIAEVLARRLPAPGASLDVLDGGCGTGLAGPGLRPYARRVSGVDLSSAMLDRARASGHYDVLVEDELGRFLCAHPQAFDVCVLVDVLTYFGDLHVLLNAAARALRGGGLLAFTVEKSSRAGFQLHPTGRYSHHVGHVQPALAGAGLTDIEISEAVIRSEGNMPVLGLIVSAFKPA